MSGIPNDKFVQNGTQWHLNNLGAGYDLNILDAWLDYSGKGVDAFILDGFFDYNHPDLAPNFDTNRDYDYVHGDSNTSPADYDSAYGAGNHGTGVAGILGAAAGGGDSVGVAYEANLVGYSVFENPTGVSNFWEIISDAVDAGADVVNMSFGYDANFLSDSAMTNQIDHAVDSGRGGLGTILVKAAGNNRSGGSNTTLNGHTGDTQEINVAAIERGGQLTSFSTPGSSVLVSAFGNGVHTTDHQGSLGYTSGDYLGFDGTSAAAPLVSGVVALMLEANPLLGWRDVQNILAISARSSDSNMNSLSGSERNPWEWNGADNWNGGGMHFSADYGYGLVDATAAVRLAETWEFQHTSANEQSSFASGNVGHTDTHLYYLFEVGSIEVERLAFDMSFSTSNVRDMKIIITAPDGTVSTLLNGNLKSEGVNVNWSFESQAFRGMDSQGQWRVDIINSSSVTTSGTMKLEVFGASASNNDTYYYTNEYSRFYNDGQHSSVLRDTDGGTDTINASAVSTNSIINLSGGASRIDGISTTITNVENVYAGDGNDTIIGNAANNRIFGGRGNDTIDGGSGIDTAIYSFARSFYNVVLSGVEYIITGLSSALSEGVDRLKNIQNVQFTDGTYAITDLVITTPPPPPPTGGDGDIQSIINGTTQTTIASGWVTTGSGNDEIDATVQGNIRVNGGAGNDYIHTDEWNVVMDGGAGNDVLEMNGSSDQATGGTGNDFFVFRNGRLNSKINDFGDYGTDKIAFLEFDNINSYADLTITQSGSDVHIDFGHTSDTLVLKNTQASDLDVSDFIFG